MNSVNSETFPPLPSQHIFGFYSTQLSESDGKKKVRSDRKDSQKFLKVFLEDSIGSLESLHLFAVENLPWEAPFLLPGIRIQPGSPGMRAGARRGPVSAVQIEGK